MKKILITGSLGYIGSVLTEYLKERGLDCVGFDAGFFKESILYPPQKTKTLMRDVRSIVESDLKGIDVLVHLAGISNDPVGKLEPAKVYDPTREYSLKLARMCKKLGVKFIFASSCSVYGLGEEEYLSENSKPSPQTPYSLNKLQIENDLKSISDEDFSPIALRFATVFGLSPRIRFDVVVNMLVGMAFVNKKIVLNSNGQAWRPNLHILDACKAIYSAIELNYVHADLLILNVGSDINNLKIIDIAQMVRKVVANSDVVFLSDNPGLDRENLIKDRKVKQGVDTRTYMVSFDKIMQVMPKFCCDWTVERGIADMVTEFENLSMSGDNFKSRGFYRLQQLEYLHQTGAISDSFFWS
jgi:nucleoside-diphosphate-sugar epimerase